MIGLFFENFLFIMFIIALVSIYFSTKSLPKKHSDQDKYDVYIRYLMFYCFGLEGLYAYIFHVFFPETSQYIGWKNSPFQFEIGIANLGVGVAGVYAFWRKKDFSYWLSTTIINSILFLGAGYGHIKDMILNGNFAPDNAGTILYTEMFVAILVPYFLYKYKKCK